MNEIESSAIRLAEDGLPQGWFFADDAAMYVNSIKHVRKGGRAVEIGTWLGRSLAIILPTVIERDLALWAIDTWQGSPQDATEDLVRAGLDAWASFQANMKQLGFWGAFSVVKEDQADAVNRFPNESLDLVFLDADHRYDSVRADIDRWWPKLRQGGVFLGHDYGPHHPGVARAVRELFREPDDVSGYVWRVVKSSSRRLVP